MTQIKTFSFACIFAFSGAFASVAHADTVGCSQYGGYKSYKTAHWEKVVKDLKTWKATHKRHHPYYNTMSKKLVSAERNWEISKSYDKSWKKSGKHNAHWKKKAKNAKHDCKHDVSPS